MKTASADLIYDVGLFDGADTAYYLFRGYRVVAIDANPTMIEVARVRFANEIAAGRLTLINAGISEMSGEATFWISDKADWSSFNKAIASRDGTGHRPMPVPAVPFSDLLAEYGVPHYLKIDIEGNDKLCVDSLKRGALPKYISVESENVSDSGALSDEQAIFMLELLRDAGYRRFKLVDQHGWRPARSAAARFRAHLVASVAHGRLRAMGLSRIAQRFTDQARFESLGFVFAHGSTGPWGDDIPGGWMSFNEAKSTYLKERNAFFSHQAGAAAYSFWYDWHATY